MKSLERGRSMVRVSAAALLIMVSVAVAACGGSSSDQATRSASGALDGHGKPFVYNAAGASAPFQDALELSFLKTFDEKFDFHTAVDSFCCGIEKLQAAERSGNVPWSAVQWVTKADYALAKKAGLLLPLDPKIVPLKLMQPGTYDRYGYQVYTSGINLAWLPKTYPPGTPHPTKFEDLFDTTRFPGKRCMYQGPQFGGVFEGAELAAGMSPSKLYPINFGVAFAELDKIKKDIVWWKSGAQAAQYLLNGTCKLGVIWNGVAQSTANQGNPIAMTWGHAITVYGMNTIPKGSPNPEAAQHLLAIIVGDTRSQVEFLSHTGYTVPLKKPTPLPASVAKWAPQGANLATAIPEDDDYYAQNSADVTKRFNDWLVTGK